MSKRKGKRLIYNQMGSYPSSSITCKLCLVVPPHSAKDRANNSLEPEKNLGEIGRNILFEKPYKLSTYHIVLSPGCIAEL